MNYDLGFELKSTSNRIDRLQNHYLKKMGYEGISVTQCGIIGYIENHDGDIYPKNLEDAFGIRSSSITGVINRMEKNGLISRAPAGHDARMKKLVVTPGNEEMLAKTSGAILSVEAELIKGISGDELAQFLSVLDRIKKALDDMEAKAEASWDM